MEDVAVTGVLTNIQRFSTHDGPGIRTVVFLKGCPLRCLWCCNPETQRADIEMGLAPDKCLPECDRCLSHCPSQALTKDEGGLRLERSLCLSCAQLAEGRPPCDAVCPEEVFVPYGRRRSVGDVLDEVERDAPFFRYEQGGLTLSGGEALFQPDFALALLREAQSRMLHTCLETCGMVPEAVLKEACRHLDYLLFDVKTLDDDAHRQATGVGNGRILSNLRMVRREFPNLPLRVRTPVIPRFNDTADMVERIARFLKELGVAEYELLTYHAYGTGKTLSLGRPAMEAVPPSDETMATLRRLAEETLRG